MHILIGIVAAVVAFFALKHRMAVVREQKRQMIILRLLDGSRLPGEPARR
jgi:hypothetical protein